MKYDNITPAVFINRPNRFIADVEINGKRETVHVKNTGRCRELLLPGTRVFLTAPGSPGRKTKYDLVTVEKRTDQGTLLVNIDSQIPNDVAGEWLPCSGLFSKDAVYTREYTFENSRFDFCVDENKKRSFIEVKGCTLENDGVCCFPDAPTVRGVKHLKGLISAANEGYGAYLLFIVQMKGMRYLVPNDATHPEFGDTMRKAAMSGVKILAVECDINKDSIVACRQIPVSLK